MPIATPEMYAEMLDAAKEGSFAFPAINVSSSQTLNAALQGFAEADSDGIVQVSTGGAEYLSGPTSRTWSPARSRSRPTPTRWPRTTRSTSPCTPTTAPRTSSTASSGRCSTISAERVARGEQPLFQSHMWDGSAVPLEENLADRRGAARGLPQGQHRPGDRGRRRRRRGGRRRGRDRRQALHRPPRTRIATVKALGTGENGRYLTALTFGNVHGVYKPGNVKLRPEILKSAQEAVDREARLPRAPGRSTWSSTAAPARRRRRSARPSTTAWSR